MRWIVPTAMTLALALATTQAPEARAVDAKHPAAEDTAPTGSPTGHALAVIDALRANDAEAFAEAVSHKSSDELAREWETKRLEVKDRQDADGEEAERVWAMLMTDEGTAALAAELQPKIAEKASTAVLQFNLGLAAMLTAIASEAELSPAESQQFSQLVLGVQRWAGGIDWSDASRVDRVLAAASGFVRRSGLASPRQVADLPYERALALGDDAIATAKLVLRAYDFDLDALLASISFEELERDGSTATVRTRLVAFGVPLDVTRELTWRRGRWSDARHHGHDEPEAKPASISITVD